MTQQQPDHITDEAPFGRYFHVMLNIADDDLDPYQYRLLGHYRRVCGDSGVCFEMTDTTAARTRMSKAKVSTTRWELVALGYIAIHQADGSDAMAVTIIDRMRDNVLRYADPETPPATRSRRERHRSHSEPERSPDEPNRSPHEQEEESSINIPSIKISEESDAPAREREILPSGLISRVSAYTGWHRVEAAIRAEFQRLGDTAAMHALERCFTRGDVRDWSYMLTALRAEPTPTYRDSPSPVPPPPSPALDAVPDLPPLPVAPPPAPEPVPDCDPAHLTAWQTAYHQLSLQLDRGSFDTLLLDARLVAVEAGEEPTFVVRARSPHAAQTLQHRLYRNVRRILSDVLCAPVALRFVAPTPSFEFAR